MSQLDFLKLGLFPDKLYNLKSCTAMIEVTANSKSTDLGGHCQKQTIDIGVTVGKLRPKKENILSR